MKLRETENLQHHLKCYIDNFDIFDELAVIGEPLAEDKLINLLRPLPGEFSILVATVRHWRRSPRDSWEYVNFIKTGRLQMEEVNRRLKKKG